MGEGRFAAAGALLVACGAALAAGCAGPALRGGVERHLVVADVDGYPLYPGTSDRIPTESAGQERRTAYEAYVEGILDAADEAFAADPALGRRLLVHVHGGLNDPESAQALSSALVDPILQGRRGDPSRDAHYPVFLTWDSGGITALKQHLFRVRLGHIRRVEATAASPVTLASDLGVGVARSPIVLARATGLELGSLFTRSEEWSKRVYPKWSLAARRFEHLAPLMTDGATGAPDGSGVRRLTMGAFHDRTPGDSTVRVSTWLLCLPPRWVFTPLLVDALGEEAWVMMLRGTENVFHTPREFDGAEEDNSRPPQPEGAFHVFFRLLAERSRTARVARSAPPYEVTLVGHSMGAIVLNRALAEFPDLDVARIVYMAPACSSSEALEAVVPFLSQERHRDTQFHVLTLHPVAEVSERNFADLVPRGSLLEWIDNWYSSPPAVTDLRFGKWENLLPMLHHFDQPDPTREGTTKPGTRRQPSLLDRVHVKVFGRRPDRVPSKHGEFNEGPFWTRAYVDPDHAPSLDGVPPVVLRDGGYRAADETESPAE